MDEAAEARIQAAVDEVEARNQAERDETDARFQALQAELDQIKAAMAEVKREAEAQTQAAVAEVKREAERLQAKLNVVEAQLQNDGKGAVCRFSAPPPYSPMFFLFFGGGVWVACMLFLATARCRR